MPRDFRVTDSTEKYFRVAPSTEPEISREEVARALGAEVVGPAPDRSGTFAAMRARAAACLASPPPVASTESKIDLDPALRKALDRLSNEFRAEGLQITASELAQRLLQLSVAEADADRKATLAKLRSPKTVPGGQPT